MKAYQIKIELVGSNPLIWRRVIIPADITFNRLHEVIQYSLDWKNEHIYEFDFPEEKLKVTNDDEVFESAKYYKKIYKNIKLTKDNDPIGMIQKLIDTTIRKPQSLKIDKYIEKYKKIKYTYDFGDNWVHEIKLESIVNDFKLGYPVVLAGEENCPPEDVGGIHGYYEFLKIWNDKNHEDYEAIRKWGKSQNYRDLDINFLNHFFKVCLKLKKNELN